MSDTTSEGFLPTAHTGPAWEEARGQLTRPRKDNAPVEGFRAGMGVRDLINRYAYALDQGDLDGLMEFFADDCVINAPRGTLAGASAIRAHYERVISESDHRFHLLTNMIVRMGDDFGSARVTTYFFGVLQNHGEPLRTVGGLLADQVVKRDGQWKICARSVSIDVTLASGAVLAAR